MLFNTMAYLLFFIFVLMVYWIIPAQFRYVFLLLASYYFYMQWNPFYIVLLVGVTLISYAGALFLEKSYNKRRQLLILFSVIILCLGILGIFKYFNLAIGYGNRILYAIGIPEISFTSRLILPVGISFYTLQSIGYLIDVYRKETYAEKNIIRYALFVSFFPQLVAGPIERSKNLLKQLNTTKKFSLYNLRKGLVLMMWGLFVKMVIADRAAIFVDTVYGDYETYNGFFIVIATILFSIQIYCDFYGYSTIARGTALTMGIELMDNFNAPYFSKNIKEFWRRWHISLSTWFRDYLYIPLGGNRKGKLRGMANLMIIFGVSGLWHGASISFVLWGLLNGAYQVFRKILSPLIDMYQKATNWEEKTAGIVARTLTTFSLTSFAWLFFRAGSLGDAYRILKNMLTCRNWNIFFDESLYECGIDRKYFAVLLISMLVLFVLDYKKYKGKDMADAFLGQYMWARILIEVTFAFVILLFGCYGELYDAASFIYFQF